MGGPVHCITSDKTGTNVALSYGSDVAVVKQYAICKPDLLPVGARNSIECDSRLDEPKESP